MGSKSRNNANIKTLTRTKGQIIIGGTPTILTKICGLLFMGDNTEPVKTVSFLLWLWWERSLFDNCP